MRPANNGKKSCKKGYYYCNTDKKCKKIPRGFHMLMPTGYLMRDSEHKDENKDKLRVRKRMATAMVQMAMEMGMGGLMGLLMAEEFQNRKTMKLQWHKANSKNQQETSKS